MHRIVLRLESPAEWIKVFDPRDGTVFVASTAALPAIGTDVRIDLTCGDEGPRVILRGTVMGHRTAANGATPGFISALGTGEREKVNYLNGFVRGGLLNLRETRLVRPISRTALAIRVIRANVMAEWLFELLPGRKQRSGAKDE